MGWRSAICLVTPVALVAGCVGASERAIIGQFFSASRLLDTTALDRVATVIFDPRTQGTVTTFSIERVSLARRKTASKEVTVSARVRQPGGTTRQKRFVITMQRAEGHADDGGGAAGGWIITGFRDAEGASTRSVIGNWE